MTAFRSQQRNRGRCIYQKANASVFNFTRQVAGSNCMAIFTKRDKSKATMFKAWCKSTVDGYRLYRVEALPLVWTRFFRLAHISPMVARSPVRWSRDGRESSGKKSGEMSRVISAQRSGNDRTVAAAMPPNVRQDDSQDNLPCAGFGRAMSAPETCETTRNLAAQQPRNISQDDSSESRRHVFNHPVLKL